MQRRKRKGAKYQPKKDEDRKPKKEWGTRQKKPSRGKVKRQLRDGNIESSDDIEWMEYDD
jgi:hypothetical protein